MNYDFAHDIIAIRDILEMSQDDFAKAIGVEQATISRNEKEHTDPGNRVLESVYDYAFNRNVQLNRLKEMLFRENLAKGHKLLFHGAKDEITGALRVDLGRANNDLGTGFYAGEGYEQAISFVSNYDKSSVYILDFNDSKLKSKKYSVDQEWMMTIAYYRGTLKEYKDHPLVKKLVEESRKCDYIIAPIADNRMFQIINSFIEGEITDEQCKHCLAATNLGSQYVFINEKAIKQVKLLERCYISNSEKEFYKKKRSEETKLGDDKVKLARRTYRGQGKYIDEILA